MSLIEIPNRKKLNADNDLIQAVLSEVRTYKRDPATPNSTHGPDPTNEAIDYLREYLSNLALWINEYHPEFIWPFGNLALSLVDIDPEESLYVQKLKEQIDQPHYFDRWETELVLAMVCWEGLGNLSSFTSLPDPYIPLRKAFHTGRVIDRDKGFITVDFSAFQMKSYKAWL